MQPAKLQRTALRDGAQDADHQVTAFWRGRQMTPIALAEENVLSALSQGEEVLALQSVKSLFDCYRESQLESGVLYNDISHFCTRLTVYFTTERFTKVKTAFSDAMLPLLDYRCSKRIANPFDTDFRSVIRRVLPDYELVAQFENIPISMPQLPSWIFESSELRYSKNDTYPVEIIAFLKVLYKITKNPQLPTLLCILEMSSWKDRPWISDRPTNPTNLPSF